MNPSANPSAIASPSPTPTPKRSGWLPRNRFLRALVVLLGVALALEGLYLVVGNVALAVVAKRFVDQAPVGVAYDRGVTFFPGRFHFTRLRLHGADAGGWTVTVDDARVAFDVWQVLTDPRRVKSVGLDVASIEAGAKGSTKRLAGAIHLDLTEVTIDGQRVAFELHASVAQAKLESNGVTLADELHGETTLQVEPFDVVTQSMLATTSGSVGLDGRFLSLAPLAAFGSLTTDQAPGNVHVAISLVRGVVAPSSELHATTARETLEDARGATGDFPRGLDVRLGVAPAKTTELQLAIRSPELVFGPPGGSTPADTFDDFELVVPAGNVDLARGQLTMASLTWSSGRARLHEGATTFSAKANGTLHFAVNQPARLVADYGQIRATDVVVERADEPKAAPFDALFTLRRLIVSRERGIALAAVVHASGEDVRPIVNLLVSSPAVRRGVGSLGAKKFVVDATVTRSDGRLTLTDFTLDFASMTVTGAYARRDPTSRGAFLVKGGPLPVGIKMTNGTDAIVLGASPSWLAAQLVGLAANDDAP